MKLPRADTHKTVRPITEPVWLDSSAPLRLGVKNLQPEFGSDPLTPTLSPHGRGEGVKTEGQEAPYLCGPFNFQLPCPPNPAFIGRDQAAKNSVLLAPPDVVDGANFFGVRRLTFVPAYIVVLGSPAALAISADAAVAN